MNEFFNGFKEGIREFGLIFTVLINSLLLFFVYIFGVGLTFLVAKLKKKHFLDIHLSKERKSYWEELNLKKKKIEDYYRQF